VTALRKNTLWTPACPQATAERDFKRQLTEQSRGFDAAGCPQRKAGCPALWAIEAWSKA
jgi:hypothetical protein